MALLEIEGMARSFTIPTGERLDILTNIELQVEAGVTTSPSLGDLAPVNPHS